MALLVREVVEDAVRVLLRDIDEGGIHWKDAELITWFNEACGEIARIRPESASVTENVDTTEGVQQSIPVGGSILLEVICNQNNGVNGRAIRRIERHMLDNEDPNWLASTPKDVAVRYVPSLTDPRTFYLYPPSTGSETSGIKIVFSRPPAQVNSMNDTVPLPDMYRAVMVNYICFRAFLKQIESAASQQRANDFLAIFNNQMGVTDRNMESRNSKARQPINPEA